MTQDHPLHGDRAYDELRGSSPRLGTFDVDGRVSPLRVSALVSRRLSHMPNDDRGSRRRNGDGHLDVLSQAVLLLVPFVPKVGPDSANSDNVRRLRPGRRPAADFSVGGWTQRLPK